MQRDKMCRDTDIPTLIAECLDPYIDEAGFHYIIPMEGMIGFGGCVLSRKEPIIDAPSCADSLGQGIGQAGLGALQNRWGSCPIEGIKNFD